MYTWKIVMYVFIIIQSVMLTKGCGHKHDLKYVKIPNFNRLMPLTEFDEHVVNYEMSRMYVGLIGARTQNFNFYSTITKHPGTRNYTQDTFGETNNVVPQCIKSRTVLIPASTSLASPEAIFKLNENEQYKIGVQRNYAIIAFWSSCPTNYLWLLKCSKTFGTKKCHTQDVTLELYVHTNLDDIPIMDIGEDLCRSTGVKFGDSNFRWTFTYGENTKCRQV